MAGFGFSIGDIAALGSFAWTLYKSCKNAGTEFKSIAQNVNILQSELRELSDEAGNPNSLIHRCSKVQRANLRVLVKSCKSDLQDLEKMLVKYKSLQTPSPRARDRLGFSTDKQTEMKNRLSTHSDRFNLFLTHLNSGALGRIETNQEIHTVAFGEIKSKLDSIHEDIREGRKDPSLLSNMGDWGALEQELVDDRITEVDVELNKDEIAEWVKQTCGEDEVNRREENARDMSRFQAAVEDANDESLKQESVKEINPDGIDGDTSPMAAFKIPTRNFAEAIAHEDSPSSEASIMAGICILLTAIQMSNAQKTHELSSKKYTKDLSSGSIPIASDTRSKTPKQAEDTQAGSPAIVKGLKIFKSIKLPRDVLSDGSTDSGVSVAPSDSCSNSVSESTQPDPEQMVSNLYADHNSSKHDMGAHPPATRKSTQANMQQVPAHLGFTSLRRVGRPRPSYSNIATEGSSSSDEPLSRPTPSRRRHSKHVDPEASAEPDSNFAQYLLGDHPTNPESYEPDSIFPNYLRSHYPPNPEHNYSPFSTAPVPSRSVQNSSKEIANSGRAASEFPSMLAEVSSEQEPARDSPIVQELTFVERPVWVTLEELYYGTRKKLKVKRKIVDNAGRTSQDEKILGISIKRGLDTGSRIKFAKVGDEIPGRRQDLHFIVSEKEHPLFKREGQNIRRVVDISLKEALKGWTRIVKTIDGKSVKVHGPRPTQPMWQECFPDLGMPKSETPTERGNFLIGVRIQFPKNFTAEQAEMLDDIL